MSDINRLLDRLGLFIDHADATNNRGHDHYGHATYQSQSWREQIDIAKRTFDTLKHEISKGLPDGQK